ncbi:MAG: homoserine kinase [Coriobacteriaceae bacterium]|nr:homoserine kinase [Coriobacteriaceae bacterium]
MRASVRVPATSANLGPGFDSFGLALALHDTFSAEPAERWAVEIVGEGAHCLPTGQSSAVVVAMKRAMAEAGETAAAAHVFCDNRVPTGRGLGSSAAAIVGGLMLGFALARESAERERVFELAAEIEGHPDNVAAAIFGGFTVCWTEDGRPRCERLGPAGGLAVVYVPPCGELRTSESRRLLPESVPHADGAFNLSHAALLASGLALGRADLVRSGLADRLHEQYRVAAVPDFVAVRDALVEAGADGAALSGAGPGVVGLVTGADDPLAYQRAEAVAHKAATLLVGSEERGTPIALAVDREGAVAESGAQA